MERIERFVNEMRANKGLGRIAVTESTSLLDDHTGIDSLDLAALVVELQIECDLDPFQDGFINFNTAGELAALFADGRK
ncbi:MAG TPA: acyl carrier protein [Candidatus Dormibacteraeota bacterium]|nr:acyl carrier protein [Candidatus Dormibacteraeota bacterium]